MVKSNYEILGIAEGASRNEIRSAFRNLALTHHADRGGQAVSYTHLTLPTKA